MNYWPDNTTKFIIVTNVENQGIPFLKSLIKNKNIEIIEIDFRRKVSRLLKHLKLINPMIFQIRFINIFYKIIKNYKTRFNFDQ